MIILLVLVFHSHSTHTKPSILLIGDSNDRNLIVNVCDEFQGRGSNFGGTDFISRNGLQKHSWDSTDHWGPSPGKSFRTIRRLTFPIFTVNSNIATCFFYKSLALVKGLTTWDYVTLLRKGSQGRIATRRLGLSAASSFLTQSTLLCIKVLVGT